MKEENVANISEEVLEETLQEQFTQQQETENETAQYSEDGRSLIKYEGNATSYEVRVGTTTICEEAFSGNDKLNTIYIPDSVESIAGNAFNGCKNLVAIEVGRVNPYFYSEDGVLYSGRWTKRILVRVPIAKVLDVLHVKTSDIQPYAFYGCSGIREVFIEPEDGKGVWIAHNAFSKSSICVLHLCATNDKNMFAYNIFDECDVEVYAPIPKLITKKAEYLSGKLYKVWPDHFPELKEEEYEVTQDEEGGIYSADGIRLVKYMGQGNIYKIKEGTKIISANAFEGRSDLVSISIPKSVEYISKEAVDGCPNLCHVFVAPDNVGEYSVKDGKLVHDEEGTIFTFSKIAD